MRFFLLYKNTNGCSIIQHGMTLKDMQSALAWQKQGGFNPADYAIAKPTSERGVFEDVETGERLTPHRGAYTESAFNHVMERLWGSL